ncbi:hypothetical protein F8154_04360 [Alkaliphilus pronyensis]|uniref:Uncharacterized protein n=1 Tax=Alkaliphilus pronyensis TaxID=1482732 RepID=A0A6I0FBX2_9FIRM|nr:hypothetical protein [Alkaliphilus pronyensis]KAB3536314.1 hypothetical protein F8154_04360 [Alkaliphilus pronyensis]
MSLLDEFYQNESSTNKETIWVFLISLIIGVVFLALFLINIDKHTLLSKIGSIYIIAMFFVLSFFTISMYWFTRKSNHNFLKPIKYIFVLISLFLIAIIFLPMTLLGLISNITKFENLPQNLSFYLLSISITLGLNFLIFPVILSGIYDIGNHVFNIYTLTIIATYFIDLILIKLFAFIRYKYQQRRDKKSPRLYKIEKFYSETKKELYVLNYALIFFTSLLLYVIKRPISLPEEVFNTLNEGIIYAFALFITYDTLKDKWKDNLSKKRFNEELVFNVISDDLKIVLIQLNNAKYTHNFNSRVVFTYPLTKIDFLLARYSKNKLCSEVLEEIIIIGTNFLDFNEVVMRCEKIMLKINAL